MKIYTFYFLSIGLLFFTFTSKAQDIVIGVKGGISIPNLSSGGSNQNPLNTGYSSREGPDFALFAEFKISDLFSLQPNLQYSSQGGKKTGMQAFPFPADLSQMFPNGSAPKYLYANFKSEAKINYLMIPVLAKFGWDIANSPTRLYIAAGPFVGFLMSAKQVTSGNSEFFIDPNGPALPIGSQSLNHTENIKNQLHSTNFGLESNVGINRSFGKNNIFIEGGFNYGFLNIQKGTENGKNNIGAGTIGIGFSRELGSIIKKIY